MTRRPIGLAATVLLLAACTSAAPHAWTGGPTLGPTASPATTASPAVASPTPSPGPTLGYPESQSRGTLTIALDGGAVPLLVADIACEWTDTGRVGWFFGLGSPTIAGERVSVSLLPDAPGQDQFLLHREDAATYHAGPTSGTVEILDLSDDRSTGRIGFRGLAPDAETAPPGPLPSPLEDWVRPFGGDPALASLTGSASWQCEPPPATVPTPGPVASEPPAEVPVDFPGVAAVVGDDRIEPSHGCGAGGTIDGVSFGNSCGPSFQAPAEDRRITLAPDGTLTVEVDDDWSFALFGYGLVTADEAIRWRGLEPDTYEVIETEAVASGRRLSIPAPAPGDWVIQLAWAARRGTDEVHGTDYFRVVVDD